MALVDICNLDYHTPKGLINLWDEYKSKFSLPDDLTTTVYQFGFSAEERVIVSFAYRSTNDFMSEKLQYGTAIKPECSNIPEGNLIDLIPKIMKEQRKIEEKLPLGSRLYIGGEIHALYLTANGCNSFKLGEFSDFEDQMYEIFRNIGSTHLC